MSWRPRTDEEAGTGPSDPTAPLRLAPVPDRRGDAILAAITDDLAASDTGIEFVYKSLNRLRDRAGVDDVMVIVDEPSLGRQAFRATREPVDTPWASDLVRSGEVGIHATPTEVDPVIASSVASLCTLAIRLDVARHDSLHDGLTGLLNRRAFDDLLAESCARSARYGWPFTLVIVDVNDFKGVNDRHGHAIGDVTLRAVANELRNGLRVGDAAARIGGDEFALLLPNADATDVPDLVERLSRAVESALPNTGVSFSAGAATAPADATDPRLLFRIADQRLYEEKSR